MRKRLAKALGVLLAGCVLTAAFTLSAAASDGAEEEPIRDTVAEQENGAQSRPIDIEGSVLTPALHILAAEGEMAVATLCGNDYYFSADVFARALNVNAPSLGYITVRSLPGTAEGELLIGSTRVSAGQVVSAASLAAMSYVAADNTLPGETTFTFSPAGADYVLTCRIHVLEELNYSPTLRMAGGAALKVSTHRDFACFGTLSAYDPEGDDLTFEIVRRPAHGLLLMTDAACGEYVYLPRLGYTGKDSFVYVVRDEYGNYSASAEVSLQVTEPSVAVSYADMSGRRDYNAALTMAEAGIMQGSEVNGKMYFYPEQTVSRVEFVTMAMQALGVGSVPSVADTGFADDGDIPVEAKGYIATAYSLGYITGEETAGELCFRPNDTITRAEAAVMLRNMVDADSADYAPTFADASDIPDWAGEAMMTLSAMGVITPSGGAISPNAPLTRGQNAMMLAALRQVIE